MEKRSLKPKEIVRDIRAGTDDATLMHKYSLSAQGLQSVFRKLVQAGMVTQAEVDERVPMAERTVDIGLFICPACGNIQAKEFSECPRCGFVPPGYLKRGKESEPPSKEDASKATLNSKSQVINLKTTSKAPAAEPQRPGRGPSRDPSLFPRQAMKKIATYCTVMGILCLVCSVLAVGAMVALTRLGLPTGALSLGQSLLAATALGIPVIVTAVMVFVTLKALGESIRVFMRLSGHETD